MQELHNGGLTMCLGFAMTDGELLQSYYRYLLQTLF